MATCARVYSQMRQGACGVKQSQQGMKHFWTWAWILNRTVPSQAVWKILAQQKLWMQRTNFSVTNAAGRWPSLIFVFTHLSLLLLPYCGDSVSFILILMLTCSLFNYGVGGGVRVVKKLIMQAFSACLDTLLIFFIFYFLCSKLYIKYKNFYIKSLDIS